MDEIYLDDSELYNILSETYSPSEFVAELGVSFEEIWDSLYDKIIENKTRLIKGL